MYLISADAQINRKFYNRESNVINIKKKSYKL